MTFGIGETSKTISLTVVGDTADEAAEWFEIRLTGPNGLTITDGAGVVTIADDDDPAPTEPAASIGNVSVDEGNGIVTLTISLDASPATSVSVDWATEYIGSANAGTDAPSSSMLSKAVFKLFVIFFIK